MHPSNINLQCLAIHKSILAMKLAEIGSEWKKWHSLDKMFLVLQQFQCSEASNLCTSSSWGFCYYLWPLMCSILSWIEPHSNQGWVNSNRDLHFIQRFAIWYKALHSRINEIIDGWCNWEMLSILIRVNGQQVQLSFVTESAILMLSNKFCPGSVKCTLRTQDDSDLEFLM